MNKLSKVLVILSLLTLIMSVTTFQVANDRNSPTREKPVIKKSPIPVLMYDIRGQWKISFDWDSEPEGFNFSCTVKFKGTKTTGTIEGVDSLSDPFNGTYNLNGNKITFKNNDPDTTPPITSYPFICKGIVKNKTAMSGTFTNGPDPGTWKAFKLMTFKPVIRKK